MIFLFQSWIESLKFFLPNNFITFFLVTIKSWLEFYKKFFIKLPLWFYFVLFIVLLNFIESKSFIAALILSLFIISSYTVILRSSVDIKDKSYFSLYLRKTFILNITFALIAILIYYLSSYFFNYYFTGWKNILLVVVRVLLFMPFTLSNLFMSSNSQLLVALFYLISPIIIFSYFFYLDSLKNYKNFFKSLYRAFLMVLYNYPFCLVSYIALGLIFILVQLIIKLISSISESYLLNFSFMIVFIFLIYLPLYLAWFGNFYLKRVHDQFKLYFKSN